MKYYTYKGDPNMKSFTCRLTFYNKATDVEGVITVTVECIDVQSALDEALNLVFNHGVGLSEVKQVTITRNLL